MESYGAGLDPLPFIAASYAVGVLLIVGYIGYIWRERQNLKKLAASLKEGP